jgi:hypothetical protein
LGFREREGRGRERVERERERERESYAKYLKYCIDLPLRENKKKAH